MLSPTCVEAEDCRKKTERLWAFRNPRAYARAASDELKNVGAILSLVVPFLSSMGFSLFPCSPLESRVAADLSNVTPITYEQSPGLQ